MFPYELRKGDKIFIVTWYNRYPQFIIYEVISLNITYNPLHENNGYTSINVINLITSIRTSIVFWNDIDLEEGDDQLNIFRTTNEQLAVKVFKEKL